ncbi:AAA family ATPase [Nocardia sp. NPDC050406]|uniref:AAA family ATPase n=1 Tax=Nocardia sp. NPDC050406 TaxID=3364318 RepID=UPI0037A6723E
MRPISVLWLTGAPGVGKSTIGWALYQRARARHLPVAYVDIDQLGLLAPAPPGDPERHAVQANNLLEVADTFGRYGAEQVVVSGVVDPARGPDSALTGSPFVDLRLIRLHCARAELRRRYLGRGSTADRLDELMAVADAFDRGGLGTPVDTTTASVDAVVERVAAEYLCRQPRDNPRRRGHVVRAATRAPVLLLTGPTAVGKSTVGWEVVRALWSRDIPAAYIDVDQLGFAHPDIAPNIKADNLTRLRRAYQLAGAQAFVVVARETPHRYLRALSGDLVTTVRLEASPSELRTRIALRADGAGPRLAGDSLVGASLARQARTADRAAAEAEKYRRYREPAALVIDTDGKPARSWPPNWWS